MFDLVGYWVAVTITSFILVLPYLLGTIALLDGMLYRISSGEVKYPIYNKVLKFEEGFKIPYAVDVVLCFLFWLLVACSAMCNIFLLVLGTNYIHIVNKIATISASFTSWLCLIVLILFIVDFVGKKLYKLSKAIKKLQDTIDE